MNKAFSPAVLLIWGLCLPLAVLCVLLIATPLSWVTFGMLAVVFLVLCSPLLIKWHHALLIFSWHSFFIVFFVPGEPSAFVVMAAVSLFISVLNRTMRKQSGFISVPSVSRPLLLLIVIILVTAHFTGGIGGQALGSSNTGAKRYLSAVGAIFGYFALTAQAVRPERRILMASLFFLSGVSGAMSDLIYVAGPSFYFLYTLVSSSLALMQAYSQETLLRYAGVTFGTLPICYFLIMRYGIRGLMDFTRPWRLMMFLAVVSAALLGGFRSSLIILTLILAVQFYFERLYKTWHLLLLFAFALLLGTGVVISIERLPLAVQRSFSFLPLHVDPAAKSDALSTLDWRLEIWKIMAREVPKYFWFGKGFSFSSVDYWLVQEGVMRGLYKSYEDTLVTGSYHSGPLTIIIPFGIWGFMAFFWFCWTALKALYANYRYGDPSIQVVNTFLLVFFVGRLLFFLIFYGQFDSDLMVFTGTIGLSISLNNGVCVRENEVAEQTEQRELAPQPILQPSPAFRTRLA